jgi:hypothetical protein
VNYKHFFKYAKDLSSDLQKIVGKRHKVSDEPIILSDALDKAFGSSTVPTAGPVTFSEVKGGITDDVKKEFELLFQKFVSVHKADTDQRNQPYKHVIKEVYRMIEGMKDKLKKQPRERSFYYPVTDGQYTCEVAFNSNNNLNLKVLSLRSQKNYPFEVQNILSAITVLSDLQKEHKGMRFGGLIYFHPKYARDAQEKEFDKLKKRFSESKLDCVRVDKDHLMKYFHEKKLLKQ